MLKAGRGAASHAPLQCRLRMHRGRATPAGRAQTASPQSRAARSRRKAGCRRSTSATGQGKRTTLIQDVNAWPSAIARRGGQVDAGKQAAPTSCCPHLQSGTDLGVDGRRQGQVVQPAAGVAAEARPRLRWVCKGTTGAWWHGSSRIQQPIGSRSSSAAAARNRERRHPAAAHLAVVQH